MTLPPRRALAIEARHVELAFGGGAGVFDLTFQAPEGAILGMIGPSGCGKTTTVRLMLGLYTPQKGALRVFGRNPAAFRAADRERIGYIPQQFVLYPNLTVAENIHFVAALYGMPRQARARRLEELLRFVELAEAASRLGSQLSGGMQRRLMLAGALMHDPDLLFADEPTAGIDPVLRGRFWEYFRALRDQGRTLFVTTQYVGEAAYCDYVAVMRRGRLIAVDTPEGLRRRALGGEVIAVTVDAAHVLPAMDLLRRHPAVRDVRPSPGRADRIHVYVEDAAGQLPAILNALEYALEIIVHEATEHRPSYDDVFITLMERAEEIED
ncbi:MAG TPA: ABC transporter ATP-binding protein [Roseiflexaceae bacterium]|nr:ABC transporter ATP-binding protein [Roseiflexaceae bacterium]